MPNVGWRALFVVVVVAGSALVATTKPIRLGLDLRGGTQVVLEAQDTDRVQVDGDVATRTLEVLRRRVDALGVAEPTLQRSGERRIIVELPGVADPDEAIDVIGRTAQLAFHQVTGVDAAGPGTATTVPLDGGEVVVTDEDGVPLRLAPAAVTGEAVSTARAALGEGTATWVVEVDFRGDGGRQWSDLTGQAACSPPGDPARRVAIVLDRDVISSPQVDPSIQCGVGIPGGTTVITGQFTESEAKDLALLIRAGALPVPVEVVEQRTVGPTLGRAAISASIEAAVIGAVLTALFLLAYYRFLGLLATVALGGYALVSLAALQAIDATLTLPGIAGFVLAIGMAVDGNVLVFERIKEEHSGGRSLRSAARSGFRRAWSAIADSNVTTLIAAVVLYFFASGGVRGFGITLSIGVLASMFSALVVTRLLIELTVTREALQARPRLWGMGVGERLRDWIGRRRPDVVRWRRVWFAIGAVAVAGALFGVASKGLSYGLEFTGGRLVEYRTTEPVDLDHLRDELAGVDLPRAIVQESGDDNVTIRTRQLGPGEERALDETIEELPGDADRVRDEFVGPTIGDELRRRALIAVGLALSAQLAYLAVRFRWTYGVSSVVAMAQNVAILVGIFAWLGKELDGVFVAALLTVIGYAINDAVVIFDRVREQVRLRPRDPFSAVANDAALETLPRTVNTGLSTLFILVALWLLGGETLADFALALIIGILVGTTSSVLTAVPLATVLERGSSASLPPDVVRRSKRSPGAPDDGPALDPVGASPSPTRGIAAPRHAEIPPRPRKNKRRKGGRR